MKQTLLRHHQLYLGDISLSPSENITGRISHCALRLLAPVLTSLIVRKFFLITNLNIFSCRLIQLYLLLLTIRHG